MKDLTIEIYAFNFETLLICFAFAKLAAKIKKDTKPSSTRKAQIKIPLHHHKKSRVPFIIFTKTHRHTHREKCERK